jgi:hypothetical protein
MPYQTRKGRHNALFIEAHDLVSRLLVSEVRRELQQYIAVCLQGFDQARGWFVAERLGHCRQDVGVVGFAASSMRCGEEKDSKGGVLDRLVLMLEPSLEQCLR